MPSKSEDRRPRVFAGRLHEFVQGPEKRDDPV